MKIDHDKWLKAYAEAYGPVVDGARAGLQTLLSFLEADPAIGDVRWAAYMMATVKHECADRWMPIEEFGKGAGRPYGKPVTVTGGDGKSYSNVYYGRGYVQITWRDNYERIGRAIKMDDALLLHPERALDVSVAYHVMSDGMRRGLFTGRKLADYVHDSVCDYRNARQIINALDQADRIKAYADRLESIFRASAA